jgi:hypothetical protein
MRRVHVKNGSEYEHWPDGLNTKSRETGGVECGGDRYEVEGHGESGKEM